ncbi:MAG: hypothetical protein HY553_11265 [Elusimicrobia bacterium]|nr:hypothetical protein [Elusimicrobiota bacterium]
MRRNGHDGLEGRFFRRPSTTERIRRRTSARVARAAAAGPAALRRRLHRLDWEPDLGRGSHVLLASAALLGLGLSGRSRAWLLLAGAATGLLGHEAATGAGPFRWLLRNLGLRTEAEIDQERETLLAGLGAD